MQILADSSIRLTITFELVLKPLKLSSDRSITFGFGVDVMIARAVLRLKFASEKHLEIVCGAVLPEIEKPANTRSRTRLEKKGASLILKVEARDTVALRATLNAYLRWVNLTAEVLEFLENAS